MCSARGNAALPALGFPIRESAGQRLFSASPRLIAAVHALHRLLVPRHPPCALPILTVIGNRFAIAGSSPRGRTSRRTKRLPVIPVRTALARRCFVGMIVQFSRSAKRRRPSGLDGAGLSKLNSMAGARGADPGPVDIREPARARAARYARLAVAGAPSPGASLERR